MISAAEALSRLREGNARFVSAGHTAGASTGARRRRELTGGQEPFAIILGCSDSRVPVELVFDQGLGDLFVIRVAGNIVAPTQIGSIEFAADHLRARLIVVLGHSQCGAVRATIDAVLQGAEVGSQNLGSIVDRVRPAVEGLVDTDLRHDPELLLHEAVRANVRVAARQLRQGSEILERLLLRDGLVIVGACYSLETGAVELLDELDAG